MFELFIEVLPSKSGDIIKVVAENITPSHIEAVTQLLGREPRGLEAIEVLDADGIPSVIRVCSLVDRKPFPTMFWLVDKKINYQLDGLESGGLIRHLQQQVDSNEKLKSALALDHRRYIDLRVSNMSAGVKQLLMSLNYYDALQKRGIGGIADFACIRCLHTYYAAHLVRANTIGTWLDDEYLD